MAWLITGFPTTTMVINARKINADGRKLNKIILSWYLLAVEKMCLDIFLGLDGVIAQLLVFMPRFQFPIIITCLIHKYSLILVVRRLMFHVKFNENIDTLKQILC